MGGFYLMHRGWMDNPAFRAEPFTDREAWLWLVEAAWYRPGKYSFNNHTFDIARGEVPTSYRTLIKTWGWGQGRLAGYMVKLKIHGMVDTRADTGFLLVRLKNYDKYQVRADTQSDTQSDTRSDTPIYRERSKRNKRSAHDARPAQDGGSASAPNFAPAFLELRKRLEYSQLPDEKIWDMVQSNG